ncbi:hypothetical protein FQZ97_1168610 [compost metagenome]
MLVERHAKAVFNGYAKLRKRAGVGQHEAHTDLVGLGPDDLRQQQAAGSGADHGGTAGEDKTAGGHGGSPSGWFQGSDHCMRAVWSWG